MPAKSRSHTSKNNLSKKAHMPVWAIVLGLIVLVGLGAFFVFKSFASTSPESSGNSTRYLPCYQGKCFYVQENDAGAVPSNWRWEWKSVRGNRNCFRSPYWSQLEYNTGAKNTYLCLTSWPQ